MGNGVCFGVKPYSKGQIAEIRGLFSILKRARYSKSVESYTKKLMAGLKA